MSSGLREKPNGNLRSLMRRFVQGKERIYTEGNWTIVRGNEKIWFRIYIDKIVFIECINGEIIVNVNALRCFDNSWPSYENFGCNSEVTKKYILILVNRVLDEVPNTYFYNNVYECDRNVGR